jgi:hypothetical protein
MRKQLLSALAPLGICLVVHSAKADTVVARHPSRAPHPDNVFTRMFPDLPSFAPQTGTARAPMQRMGARNDLIDAADKLTDPVQSILNPSVFSPNNPDNPDMIPGMTCAAASARRGASSTGRPSSISATATRARTSASTPGFRRS